MTPEQVDTLLTFGQMALEQGWYDQARDYFEQALGLDASNQEAMKGLARANEMLGRKAAVPVEPMQVEPVESPRRVVQRRKRPWWFWALVVVLGLFGCSIAMCLGILIFVSPPKPAPTAMPTTVVILAPTPIVTPTKPSLATLSPTPSSVPTQQPTSAPVPTRTSPPTATPTIQMPIMRIGDTIPEFSTANPSLSLTLLSWKESDIAIEGPYISGYYAFTAKPGRKFIILTFRFQNNWTRPQNTPYLNAGEVATDKGYFYPMWHSPVGIHSEEYDPREATDYEIETLVGDSGAFEELWPEESIVGRVVFEIPEDETPIEASISGVPYPIKLDRK